MARPCKARSKVVISASQSGHRVDAGLNGSGFWLSPKFSNREPYATVWRRSSMSSGDPVVVRSGETVRFPVASEHPLAQFQQLKAVSEVANVHDLAIVRALTRANPELSTAQINSAVTSIIRSSGASGIIVVHIPVDFHVEHGATVVFAGPITTMTANNVYVDGRLIAHGSLNVRCASFGGTPRITLPHPLPGPHPRPPLPGLPSGVAP
jgi:hypothetical protein